jgi:chitin disaccharide deacetylase
LPESRAKYLIINADDFGVQPSTNKAITELFNKGLISSSSLLTVSAYSAEAARLSSVGNLNVGVHLTINSDDQTDRWHSNSPAQSLNDNKGLLFDMKKLAVKSKSKDVTAELEAQYQYMVDNGCQPDHADNHCGTLYGINGRLFFMNAFRFCKKHDLPFRFPLNPAYLARQFNGKAPAPLVWAHAVIRRIAENFELRLPDDMLSHPFSIKKIKSYEDLQNYYIREIRNIGYGVTEVFLHPSYPLDDEPTQNESEWLKREYELKLLKSGDILALADKENIKIVSWANAPFSNRKTLNRKDAVEIV